MEVKIGLLIKKFFSVIQAMVFLTRFYISMRLEIRTCIDCNKTEIENTAFKMD